ncbi:hypothetical protein Leryth_005266 [Lithospermum erythrorhizon]|nr:hypothetical protein Leryth_005266 [Lithospermum erythrorhizon]
MEGNLPIWSTKSERGRFKSKSVQSSRGSLVMARCGEQNVVSCSYEETYWAEKRIVEVETELTFAKSQGFLKSQVQQHGSSSGKKFLAVIGIYTGFGGRLNRNMFRASWMPKGDALTKLEERGIVIRFVIGRSPNRGDSLDRSIDEEGRLTKDFLILIWDSDFYVKVDDNINLDLDGLIELLESRRAQESAYIGCMKSGEVVTQMGRPWYEPDWWKFGDEKSYFRHAAGSAFVLTKTLAQHIHINSAFLKTYAFDDTTVGAWMMGVQATYIDDSHKVCTLA